MKEVFDVNDLNTLFNSKNTMHDETMTRISIVGNKLLIEYGNIGENDYYKPYKKVTVKYVFDDDYGVGLNIIKITKNGTKEKYYAKNGQKIDELNDWNMLLYSYSIDIFGEMTLHFNIGKGRKYRNAELIFRPEIIEYDWE